MYFQTDQVIFVSGWPKGSLLVCDWPHSVFGQNHLFVKMVSSGIPLFRVMLEDFALLSRQKFSESLSAIRMMVPSRLDAHLSTNPSVRMTCLTVRTPDRPSIIRPDDVPYRPNLHYFE
jgi:hypothetical protein